MLPSMPPPCRPRLSFSRRRVLVAAGGLALACGRDGQAQDAPLWPAGTFRVATGGVSGAYFALASALAGSMSEPPGSPVCRRPDECGIAGMTASAQTSAGSVENVELLRARSVESAFVQGDVAYRAFKGLSPFKDKKLEDLRALAALYVESLHLVVRGDGPIKDLGDLRKRRLAVDEEGSGTLLQVRRLLQALGWSEKEIEPAYLKPAAALPLMREGKLDGMFVTGGVPMPPVAEALREQGARIVPIEGPRLDEMLANSNFLTRTEIEAGAYGANPAVRTIGVTAQWLVLADLPEALAYALVGVLFQPRTMSALAEAHPRGADIMPANAFSGLGVPLHPGALRFFKDQGVAPADAR